jgi:hypothetical protein
MQGTYPLNAVFANPDWNRYVGYQVSTAASGNLHVDSMGRQNWLFFAGETIGMLYRNNEFVSPCNAVALVLSGNAGKFHSFPYAYRADATQCVECGRPIAHAVF